MNKTLNINLAGLIFHIDENAYNRLEQYLNTLKKQFAKVEGGKEIISDIETRIAELFRERTGESKEVINLDDVDQVIAIMGQPEDYLEPGEEAKKEGGPEVQFTSRKKRIYRDPDNRIIGGVASGVAAYFNVDAIWIRLSFILLLFAGFGFLFYLIMWLIIPKASTTAEKLQMRGERVNISNIERSIREEMEGIESRVSNYDYKKSGSHLSTFFSDLGEFIMDALRVILRVVGKLFGLFFLLLGFIILISLIVGLFAGGVEILGSGYGFSDLFDFFKLVTISDGHYNLLVAGIILSVIAPFFLLLYLGIRLLFNLEPLNSATRSGLVFTTFLGLVFIVVAGIQIGIQFDDRSEISNEIDLNGARNYTLTLKEDSLQAEFLKAQAPNWIHDGEMNAFDYVYLDIKPAKGDQPYLKVFTYAQGHDRKAARFNAREVYYDLRVEDSIIYLPNYYRLSEELKFRGQYIKTVLFLPDSHSVYIDESVVEMLDDVDNVQHEWDLQMGKTWWDMTEFGLSCRGCEIPEEETDKEDYEDEELLEEEDYFQIEETDSIDKMEIKIDENGIRIRTQDNDGKRRKKSINLQASHPIDRTDLLPLRNALRTVI